MDWTVQGDSEPSRVAPNLEELLRKVVDLADDGDDIFRDGSTDALSGDASGIQNKHGITHPSQLFSLHAVSTDDMVTPTKDSVHSVNLWLRGHTPASTIGSPVGVPLSDSHTPGSGIRSDLSPFNSSADDTMAILNPAEISGNSTQWNLNVINEQRRILQQQMENLAMQEREIRRQPHFSNKSAVAPFSNNFNPYLLSPAGQPTSPFQEQPLGTTPSLSCLRGRVYETAKDQQGCRLLQRALESSADPEVRQMIIVEIAPHVAELMTDQYANFLIQKLFDIMPHEVRYSVAKAAAPQMPQIALTAHGTFSVQKLIETITTREEMIVVRDALSADVLRLAVDVHGNHVIQKVLQRFDHPDKQFIYDAIIPELAPVAMNKQGCCVLQRCLDYASPAQHSELVSTILACALKIVQDPYGNYVLQCVLDSNESSINNMIGQAFLPHLVPLAINKFSSNVMEKVLRRSSQFIRDKYCEALSDPQAAARLLSDDYGNYVMQTALSTGSIVAAEGLVRAIRPLMHLIRNAPYAKKLEAKMEAINKRRSGDGSASRHRTSNADDRQHNRLHHRSSHRGGGRGPNGGHGDKRTAAGS